MPRDLLRRGAVTAALISVAWAPVALAAPPCIEAAARGEDVKCQIVLKQGGKAPYRGVLLSPAESKRIQADLATLETAFTEQKALTEKARAERDAARAESRDVVTDLLQTGQRLERANTSLVQANAALDASNRELGEAVERMPTTFTLALTAVLIGAAAFGAGYGLGKLID